MKRFAATSDAPPRHGLYSRHPARDRRGDVPIEPVLATAPSLGRWHVVE